MRNKVFIILAAMMTLAATSCQKEETSSAIQFTASAEATQGKAFYNQNGLFWNSLDQIFIHPLAWDNYRITIPTGDEDPIDFEDLEFPFACYLPTANAPYAQSTTLTFNEDLSSGVSRALTAADGPFFATTWPAYPVFVDREVESFWFNLESRSFIVGGGYGSEDTPVFSDHTTTYAIGAPMVAYSQALSTGSNNLHFYHLCGLVRVNITLPEGYDLSDFSYFEIIDTTEQQKLTACYYNVTFNTDGTLNNYYRVSDGLESSSASSSNPNDCCMFVNPGLYCFLTFMLCDEQGRGFEKTMKPGAELEVTRAGITTVNIVYTMADFFEPEDK